MANAMANAAGCARGAVWRMQWRMQRDAHAVRYSPRRAQKYTIVQTERDDYANTNSNNSCYNIDSERETKTFQI